MLTWSPVAYATKYRVTIATDRSLAQPVATVNSGKPIETAATVLAVPFTLNTGEYFWAVQPLDAAGHPGASSEVRSFTWGWNAGTPTRVVDGNDRPEVFDPLLEWDAVAGAAKYDVQVSSEEGFGPNAVVFQETVAGTSVAPTKALPNNNRWYWRMRAVDPEGRAGAWQPGPSFLKPFDDPDPAEPGDQTIENLHVRDHTSGAAMPLGATADDPIVAWDPVPGAAQYEVRVVPQVRDGDPSSWYCDWGRTTQAVSDPPNGTRYVSLKVRTPVPYLDLLRTRARPPARGRRPTRPSARPCTRSTGSGPATTASASSRPTAPATTASRPSSAPTPSPRSQSPTRRRSPTAAR